MCEYLGVEASRPKMVGVAGGNETDTGVAGDVSGEL